LPDVNSTNNQRVMKVITTSKSMHTLILDWKSEGKKIGFVPTMGALHAGHLSLVRNSKAESDFTVVSIFVNPNQFNNASDLEKYPRTFEKDKEMLELEGADVLFFPSIKEIYPQPDLRKFDFGKLENVMEGEFRPGHFNGVAQVVSRLFDIVQPQKAYFGEKDFQQLAIIQAMVKQLNLAVEIVPCPTFREANGLAMSSRNERLSPEGREKAKIIYQILKNVQSRLASAPISQLKREAIQTMENSGFLKPEYFEVSKASTLEPALTIEQGHQYVICTAVWLEDVRLIDNIRFSK
jgi:pantoate--beta-alanine ligase